MYSNINQENVTEEILKYKELLTEQIITKEEFSIKKKELLREAKAMNKKKELKI